MSHLLASEPFHFFSAQNTSVSRLTFLAHVLSSVSPLCLAVPFHFLTHLALLLRILGFKAFPHHYCSDLTFLFQIIHIISLSASFFPHPAQCSLLLSISPLDKSAPFRHYSIRNGSVAFHLCSIVNAASAPKIRTAMSCTNFVRQPRKQRTVRLMPLTDSSFEISSNVYFSPVKLPSRSSEK